MSFLKNSSGVLIQCVDLNTRVRQFAVIPPAAKIGSDYSICSHVLIENDATIGDMVTIKSGVQIWGGLSIGENVFFGPNVTFTNDPYPRRRHYPAVLPATMVKIVSSIGGGNRFSGHSDWPQRGGDEVVAVWRRRCHQLGAHRSLCVGAQR